MLLFLHLGILSERNVLGYDIAISNYRIQPSMNNEQLLEIFCVHFGVLQSRVYEVSMQPVQST